MTQRLMSGAAIAISSDGRLRRREYRPSAMRADVRNRAVGLAPDPR